MKFGYLGANSAAGIHPARLAAEIEARGFESMWLPEHTHIPTSRRSPYGAGGELPVGYRHMMSPLVSLAGAAATTSTLVLGSGICLALEHDLVDLATMASTLDVLSGGRFVLGVGAGWNAEELATHRPDLPFRMRYAALAERMVALRALWSDDPVSFEGRWHSVGESWVNPKPRNGSIPIAIGMAGDVGLPRAAEIADEWCPIDVEMRGPDGRMSVASAIDRFRAAVLERGREPTSVPITIFAMRPARADVLERYESLGVARVVFGPPEMTQDDEDETLRQLDELVSLLDPFLGG